MAPRRRRRCARPRPARSLASCAAASCPPAAGSCSRPWCWAGPSWLGAWSRRRVAVRLGRPEVSRAGLSYRLRKAFEHLGPTYIKLGQILSSGEGIFPPELVDEFRLLRDRVPAERFEVVREVVEADLGRPLRGGLRALRHDPDSRRLDRPGPRGHACAPARKWWSRSSGRRSTGLVRRDLAAMSWLAPPLIGRIPVAALANPPALIELFAETIVEELDFRLEADNMLDIAGVLARRARRPSSCPGPTPSS